MLYSVKSLDRATPLNQFSVLVRYDGGWGGHPGVIHLADLMRCSGTGLGEWYAPGCGALELPVVVCVAALFVESSVPLMREPACLVHYSCAATCDQQPGTARAVAAVVP